MKVSTIGVDIAKSVFQVHGEDAAGKIVVERRLGRKRMIEFSPSFRRAWWRSRLAEPRTTGAARCARSAMTCG